MALACLAHSRKNGGFCIAGMVGTLAGRRFATERRWIRLEGARPGTVLEGEYVLIDREGKPYPSPLRPLDVVRLWVAGEGCPDRPAHHVENVRFVPSRPWIRCGRLPYAWAVRASEGDRAGTAFVVAAAPERTNRCDAMEPERAAGFGRSLCLLHVRDLVLVAHIRDGRPRWRARFRFGGRELDLAVTDPLLGPPDPYVGTGRLLSEACLTVSLGEVFEQDGLCYKLVAAVLTPGGVA